LVRFALGAMGNDTLGRGCHAYFLCVSRRSLYEKAGRDYRWGRLPLAIWSYRFQVFVRFGQFLPSFMLGNKRFASVTRDESLVASSMTLASPSCPKGPYRFIGREYLLIHYETEPNAIREMLPEPLELVNCRVADLPVRKVLFGRHLIANLTLPYGEVLLDHVTRSATRGRTP
jgi:hypothetical protein